MRQIKFRAWDKKENCMVQSFTIEQFTQKQYPADDVTVEVKWTYYENAPELILMQFTGLKDESGVEIYEGDLITNHGVTNDMKQRIFVVVWNDEQARFSLHDKAANMKSGLDYAGGLQQEIIGNIHENSELLEKANG